VGEAMGEPVAAPPPPKVVTRPGGLTYIIASCTSFRGEKGPGAPSTSRWTRSRGLGRSAHVGSLWASGGGRRWIWWSVCHQNAGEPGGQANSFERGLSAIVGPARRRPL